MGSTRVARIAGTSVASDETVSTAKASSPKVGQSVGSTPNSIPARKRVRTRAPATPRSTPAAARVAATLPSIRSVRTESGRSNGAENPFRQAEPSTASMKASPYRSSFSGPTPETARKACGVDGRVSAKDRSVLSLNTI